LTEVSVEKFPWIQAIVIVTIAAFLGIIWAALIPYSLEADYNLGYVGCALSISPLPFLLILLSIPLMRMRALKMDISTLAVLYTIGISSSFFINEYYPWYQPAAEIASRYVNSIGSMAYIPSFMAPDQEVANQIIYGKVPIPWMAWVPTILFWWIFEIAFTLFMISIATILRKQWIDLEKVPFPQTIVAYQLVEKIAPKEGGLLKRLGRPFLLGLLIGLAVQVPIFMTTVFPWFPDIYGWKTNTCLFGSTYLTSDSPLAWIAGIQTFNKWPPFAAVFYLAPANILLSSLLWYLIYFILTQIAYIGGYYTGLLGLAGCGRNWCGINIPTAGPPFKWAAVSNIGGPIGLTLFYLLLNRRYVANTIRAALGRMPPEELKNFEADEPISYRMTYLILLSSFVLIIIIFLACGFSPFAALVIPVVAFIVWIASVRVFGLFGFNAVTYGGYGTGFVWLMWPTRPDPISREWFLSMLMQRTFVTDGFGYGWPGMMPASLASYKMGALTQTDNKTIFKAMVLASVVAPLIAMIGMIWTCYAFGLSNMPVGSGVGDIVNRFVTPGAHENWPAAPPWVANALAGVIIVGALSFLHARYIWFPLEPIGFLMATTGHTLLEGVWTTLLVAWVAKTLTLRIGGSKIYESLGAPLASGMVVGTVIAILVGGLFSIIRFFVPF
jgi:hypothetical protein